MSTSPATEPVSTPRARQPRRRHWIYAQTESSDGATAAANLAHAASLPLIVAELLVARGLHTADDVTHFLHPQFDQLLDPYSMLGMSAAVPRIQQAIAQREPILIYGDYDVDGTTATVLLKTAIEMLGGTVTFHVPHRLKEGYGMRDEILESAAANGVRLVISVDTGIRAFAAARAAEALGLDLIVTDHHLPEADPVSGHSLPRALAVLNPNQPDCEYACKHLCGAGVAFKLAQALLEAQDRERARTKILPSFLKILAIATVADAVPLLGENRVFVALGLDGLRRPVNPGLRELMKAANLDPSQRKLTPVDVGFRLGPRINAAGRMDIASEVVELFTTRDLQRAQFLAEKLERLNTERRETEAAILSQIEERLKTGEFAQSRCIVMDGEGWHRGIIGILASRIVDQTGKPALVITRDEEMDSPPSSLDTAAHGSGRSVPSFHLLDAIETCRDLFTRFGGHAHAVGFSLPSAHIPQLRARLEEYASQTLPAESPGAPLTIHAHLALDRITPALFTWLRRLEPFGMGNEEPVFVSQNVRVAAAPRFIKDRHVRLQFAQGPRAASFPAIAWNWAERVQSLNIAQDSIVHIAYKLRENEHPEFGGLELEIIDLEMPH